jgi:cytochrome c peroxidase
VKQLIHASAVFCAVALITVTSRHHAILAQAPDNVPLTSRNAFGILQTVNVNGRLDLTSAFFQELGTNGRSCSSCHRPAEGWTITPESIQRRFDESQGFEPLFRTNDGSNCVVADTSSVEARRNAFSLLLNKGLIRVGITVPPGAEFVVTNVDDPYACGTPLNEVSMYRRPLPSTNLRFLTAVMWDGRESTATSTLLQDLTKQADDATTGHAEAFASITARQAQQIVDFESGLFTAQAYDNGAGPLYADGATGGQRDLSREPFFVGINDPVGLNPTGAPFDSRAFTLFDSWASTATRNDDIARARAAILRGQEIFNTKPFVIAGVRGLNNETFSNGFTAPASISGTCTVCHDSPNVGNHSVRAPLDIGLSSASRRTADMPLYTLQRISTGDTVETTDPGRAMVTGKWADIGKFKGPILRGLSSRAPYFHNGSAASLEEVVEFYETRFNIGLTPREKADLVAFLRAL